MADFEGFTSKQMNTVREILQVGTFGEFGTIVDRWANSVAMEEYAASNDEMTWAEKQERRKMLNEAGFDLLFKFARSYKSKLAIKL